MLLPKLPLDLERVILEISALSRPLSIPTLMLVAWRVKLWFVHLAIVLPNLTHLSFNSRQFLPVCDNLLAACNPLRVLVFLKGGDVGVYVVNHGDWHNLARDTRFVVMRCRNFVADWQMGVHHGVDYWKRAEDFISKRRAGEINVLQYVVADDASEAIE
ncbi:hypothetical protein FB451DRAFT_1173563 [Mycena latifolia]|nr:hypothetical protein FB451DRAFT_1173563 [Mycena latifolia]